ncbi:hypothetical protein Tco_1092015 [Tanacetum coccineum]|uniref:Uncharacterized protein n=1 Tax=Tanacetum coccineum TaxID=301880 RepID=A0ABQ5I8N4_9ASTR
MSSLSPKNYHTIIESLPTSTTLIEDSDPNREEIDIFSRPDDSIPPGIESDFDSEEDIIDNLLNGNPTHERLTFNIEPDAPVINNVDELNKDECFYPGGGTDIAKILRKRSKPDKHGHGNGIECTRAGRMLSKGQNEIDGVDIRFELQGMTWHHETSLKVPHWLKPKRELHVGLTSSTSRTENLHYLYSQKKHKGIMTHGLPRWQSVCSKSNPTATNKHPMIGKGIKGQERRKEFAART